MINLSFIGTVADEFLRAASGAYPCISHVATMPFICLLFYKTTRNKLQRKVFTFCQFATKYLFFFSLLGNNKVLSLGP